MRFPQQPRYKCIIQDTEGNVFNVTADMVGEVSYTEQGDYLNVLEFKLTNATYYSKLVQIGAHIYFEGGAFNPENSSDNENYKTFFQGYVHKLTHHFPAHGFPEINFICYDGIGVKATRIWDTYKYPGNNAAAEVKVSDNGITFDFINTERKRRDWANKSKIRASEIVENIIEDMAGAGGKIPVRLGILENGKKAILIDNDIVFTRTSPETQKNESDWAFLRRFAKKLNCTVWSEYESDAQVIYFISNQHVKNIENDLSFVYPIRGSTDRGAMSSDAFVNPSLKPNQVLLSDVTVDEDTESAMALSRTYVKAGTDEKGEPKFQELIEFVDPATHVRYRYELDQQKAEEFSREHSGSQIYNFTSTSGMDEILSFYKLIEKPEVVSDKDYATIQRPWVGWKVNAKCEGSVRIKGRQHYKIFGILKFSSDGERNDFKSDWYLYIVRHVWSAEAYNCELSFMK